MSTRRLALALPPGYRAADVLAFHGRDREGLGEQVEGQRVRKGVLLGGVPVLFELQLTADQALCRIDADGDLSASTWQLVQAALPSLLGLRIDPAPFAALVHDDPQFAPLVARQPGLRIVQSASVFEALTWAIIGQQINLPFAIRLRRTFISQAGRAHSSGIHCYPEALDVARLAPEALTAHQFSRAKAETLLRVARLAADGALALAQDDDPALAAAQLLAIKGIGPWTVNYTLLRGYGFADCSLEGDVAVRSALGRLLGMAGKPDQATTQAWLARYRPQRTMAAAYLWASLQAPAA
jgi:DNA-3-methyladenine glycosylase II